MSGNTATSWQHPIALLSFNRPWMLERVLRSLKGQTRVVGQHHVHLFQDGAWNPFSGTSRASAEEIEACVAIFRTYFPDGTVHQAPCNMGIALNFERAEKFVFETLKAEIGIFFEDDLVLSPHYLDALGRLSEFALNERRVGYVAAYGDHHSPREEHSRRRRELVPMGHNWGFALTRRQWEWQREIVEGYLGLVRNCEYRQRPIRKIQDYFDKLGMPTASTSQDKAKEIAGAILGTVRIMCFPAYGHYIGETGEHYTPELYRQLDFGGTVLFDQAPEGFDFPSSRELDRMAERNQAALRAIGNAAVAISPQESLPPRLFVQTLYWGLLDRDPDPVGFKTFTEALDEGSMQPVEVLQTMMRSPEFLQKQAARSIG
jgi:hypothetical protein